MVLATITLNSIKTAPPAIRAVARRVINEGAHQTLSVEGPVMAEIEAISIAVGLNALFSDPILGLTVVMTVNRASTGHGEAISKILDTGRETEIAVTEWLWADQLWVA